MIQAAMDAENPRGDGDGAAHGEGDQSAEKKTRLSAPSLSDMFSEILQESASNNNNTQAILFLGYYICDYQIVAIFLLDIFF